MDTTVDKPENSGSEHDYEATMDETENDEAAMDETQNVDVAQAGTFTLVANEDVSQAYENDENSPEVMNVMPVRKEQGIKRKSPEQEVVKAQKLKKLKQPEKVQPSIFDPESNTNTSTPIVDIPIPPKAKKAAKPKQRHLEPEDDHLAESEEDVAPPKQVAKKGKMAKVFFSEEEEGATSNVPMDVVEKKKRAPSKAKKQGNPAPEVPKDVPEKKTRGASKVKEQEIPAPEVPEKKTRGASKVKEQENPAPEVTEKKTRGSPKSKEVKKPARKAPEPAPIKIKLPMVSRKGKKTVKVMIFEAMEVINDARKGVTFKEVSHFITTEYQYENEGLLKKTVKQLLSTGNLVKTTGVGLNGKFKLPAEEAKKLSTKKKKDAINIEYDDTPRSSKIRKSSTPVNSMTKTKINKKRKSVNVQVVKIPKVPEKIKKANSTKETKSKAKLNRTKTALVAKKSSSHKAQGSKKGVKTRAH